MLFAAAHGRHADDDADTEAATITTATAAPAAPPGRAGPGRARISKCRTTAPGRRNAPADHVAELPVA